MLLCHNCQKEKPEDCFYKQTNTKRGYRKHCKECLSLLGNQYYINNKENKKKYAIKHKDEISKRQKRYREENKQYLSEQQKIWREENKELIQIQQKGYREENKQYLSEQQKIWREENKHHCLEYRRNYDKVNKKHIADRSKKYREENKELINQGKRKYYHNKLKNNIDFRIKSNLRRRLNAVVRGQEKHKKTLELLGCTLEEFKKYIESKFTEGMNWDNYGVGGWHIDHIKPLSHFDLKDPKQLEEASHFTNMQPMWEGPNCSKSDRYIG